MVWALFTSFAGAQPRFATTAWPWGGGWMITDNCCTLRILFKHVRVFISSLQHSFSCTFFIQVNACGPHGWEACWMYSLSFKLIPIFTFWDGVCGVCVCVRRRPWRKNRRLITRLWFVSPLCFFLPFFLALLNVLLCWSYCPCHMVFKFAGWRFPTIWLLCVYGPGLRCPQKHVQCFIFSWISVFRFHQDMLDMNEEEYVEFVESCKSQLEAIPAVQF